MKDTTYHPEPYWSTVAERIGARQAGNLVAGDDEPYYRYKRERFLEMLASLSLDGKSVLEIGHGGNLQYILDTFSPSALYGVDISQNMVDLARKNLPEGKVEVQKIDGTTLPFGDDSIDVVFTATVLQHNTDEAMLQAISREIVRVAKSEIHIFERIDDPIAGDELCLGRPVTYYQQLFEVAGFELRDVKFINIHSSYLMAGAIRKGLNRKDREEGEPLNGFSRELQTLLLPITKKLDKVLTKQRDLARLSFVRK